MDSREGLNLARYVSFRFDDGFMAGARTAVSCLAPDCGTFFLVADLVTEGSSWHPEPLFRGRSFGSLAEWKDLADAGQDIQLHGRTHRNMKLLPLEEQRSEVAASLALTQQIHAGPYVFCHPFNRRVDLDYAALGISAAGFETRTSEHPIAFHRLANSINRFDLCSWAVRERHFSKIMDQLAMLPDDSWAVLAFHSFDDEGHEPWSASSFRALVSECRNMGLKISPVSEMVRTIA